MIIVASGWTVYIILFVQFLLLFVYIPDTLNTILVRNKFQNVRFLLKEFN